MSSKGKSSSSDSKKTSKGGKERDNNNDNNITNAESKTTSKAIETKTDDKPQTPTKKTRPSPPKRRPGQKKEEAKKEDDMTDEQREEKKKQDRALFVKEKCTTFHFIFKKKEDEKARVKTYIFEDKMECYADIQRCIARYINTNNVFIVQSMDKKDILGSKDFVVAREYRIKEVFAKKMVPEFYPSYSIKWDFYEYHGKPHNWTDYDEIRKRKKEEAKEREEALRLIENMDDNDDDL